MPHANKTSCLIRRNEHVYILSETDCETGHTEGRPSRTPGWPTRRRDANWGQSHQHVRSVGRGSDPEGAASRKCTNKRTGPKAKLAEAGTGRASRTRSERRRKQRGGNPSSRTAPTARRAGRSLEARQDNAVRHDHSKRGPRRTKGMGTIAQSTETHEQRNENL